MSYPNLPVPPEWYNGAACRTGEIHPDAWHPRKNAGATAARAACRRCPVKTPCLAYALSDPTLAGIWADTTGPERARMRRAATAVAHG